jgi:hypothetical protein
MVTRIVALCDGQESGLDWLEEQQDIALGLKGSEDFAKGKKLILITMSPLTRTPITIRQKPSTIDTGKRFVGGEAEEISAISRAKATDLLCQTQAT